MSASYNSKYTSLQRDMFSENHNKLGKNLALGLQEILLI